MQTRPVRAADMRLAGVPRGYWGVRIEGVSPAHAVAVRTYLAKLPQHLAQGKGLVVTGDVGAGKTAVGVLVVKQTRALCRTAHYVTPGELREAQRNGTALSDGMLLYDRVREVDVLVLDGLRAVDATMPYWGASDLEELATYRVQHRKLTVLTLAMDAQELRQHYAGTMAVLRGYFEQIHLTRKP